MANTIDLIYLLAHDVDYGPQNRELFQSWVMKHAKLADEAAKKLQPIWSQAHSKPVSFEEARSVSEERFRKILGELNLSR